MMIRGVTRILQPYTLAKDVRTEVQTAQVDKVPQYHLPAQKIVACLGHCFKRAPYQNSQNTAVPSN